MSSYWLGVCSFAFGAVMLAVGLGPTHPVVWVPPLFAVPFFVWAAKRRRAGGAR